MESNIMPTPNITINTEQNLNDSISLQAQIILNNQMINLFLQTIIMLLVIILLFKAIKFITILTNRYKNINLKDK